MEANRDAAEVLLTRAQAALDREDDAEAERLVLKSLRLYETEEGRRLEEHITKFGPESQAAQTVSRIMQASSSGDHYATLNLRPPATMEQLKKAYKRLSLEVHNSRCQTIGASAFLKKCGVRGADLLHASLKLHLD